MRFPTKTIERDLFRRGYRTVIAVDEVGMGCLAGPVVVCAVAFDEKFYQKTHRQLARIRDSKLLSPQQREAFVRALLMKKNLRVCITRCIPRTIDRVNIYQAARRAMGRAITRLVKDEKRSARSIVLVDGPHTISRVNLEQRAIVKGDRTVFAIACASILAKVSRDHAMVRYAKKFPGYGFEIHKGYGTKLHIARLAARGPCEIHRRSFSIHRSSVILT